jgi:hypothetical protein
MTRDGAPGCGYNALDIYSGGKKVNVKLSPSLTNKALRHEGVWGSGCIDPHFLDLGTSSGGIRLESWPENGPS